MKKFTISSSSIHSFADVVTNSSSEVFMSADNSTKEKIIQLVNALFKVAKSNLVFEDVFTVDFSVDWIEDDILDALGDAELEEGTPEYTELYNNLLRDSKNPDFGYKNWGAWSNVRKPSHWDERGIAKFITISVKDGISEEASIEASKLLTDINSFYNYDAYANY